MADTFVIESVETLHGGHITIGNGPVRDGVRLVFIEATSDAGTRVRIDMAPPDWRRVIAALVSRLPGKEPHPHG